MTLRFEAVTRRFGHHTVLAGIDLEVPAGRRLALLGPNGAGKTTLLRLAAGLLRPTTGRVERDGVPTLEPAGRRGLAFLGQDAPVYPELTVREHLHWWARMHGVDAALEWLDHAGLRRVAEDRASALSRGQRQRLHLAMALAIRPSVLLLDEPTTALDDEGRQWMLDALQATDAALLVATHEPDLASRLGAETLHLRSGRLEAP